MNFCYEIEIKFNCVGLKMEKKKNRLRFAFFFMGINSWVGKKCCERGAWYIMCISDGITNNVSGDGFNLIIFLFVYQYNVQTRNHPTDFIH